MDISSNHGVTNQGAATGLDQFLRQIFAKNTAQNIQSSSINSNPKAIQTSLGTVHLSQDFARSIFENLLVGMGIYRGEDGTRTGFLAKTVDWLAGTKLGEILNIAKSSTQTASTLAQTTSKVAAEEASSLGGTVVGAGVAIYDFFKNLKNMDTKTSLLSGATVGATVGFQFGGPIGAGIGALVGVAAGGLSKLFGSKKPKDQKERDQMRKMLIESGVIDKNYTIGLADGTRFDIGIDGKARQEWGGRKYFEPDLNDPMAAKTYEVFLQITSQMMGGNENLSTSLAGYFTKAALSNAAGDQARIQENIKAIFGQLGIK